jgi:hypothetical protein
MTIENKITVGHLIAVTLPGEAPARRCADIQLTTATCCLLQAWTDDVSAAHKGPQYSRHLDRAVGLLVVLENGQKRPAKRQTRAIQGVDELRPGFRRRSIANSRAPRLEIAAVATRRDLAIRVLAREPDLEIERFL